MRHPTGPQDLKMFYQCNPHYFEVAAAGTEQGTLFAPHKRVHAYVRSLTGKRVLDFGCADGRDIEGMYNSSNTYVGVDVSEGALLAARSRFARPNVDYVLSDITGSLPFQSGDFDVITSFFTFEHVLSPGAVLSEFVRVLAPDGDLLLITPNYPSPGSSSLHLSRAA